MLTFFIPARVVIGEGSVGHIGKVIKDYGERVFLVHDAQSAKETVAFHKLKSLLEKNSYGVLLYNRSYPVALNSTTTDVVNRGVDQARHARCNVVLGFGDLATLYTAKAIAYILSNDGKVEDYLHGKSGTDKTVSYIEVPINHSLVSGLTNFFYVVDKYDNVSKCVTGSKNYADLVIVDPSLMSPVYPGTNGYLGLDILSLSIEAFLSKGANIFAQSFALNAISIIFSQLISFTKDPANVDFRLAIANASVLSSLAIANSFPGTCFALSMVLNSIYNINQDFVAGILLPYIMEFNLTSSANQYVSLFRSIGKSTEGVSVVEVAIKMIEEVRRLIDSLGLAKNLEGFGIDKNDFAKISKLSRNYDFMSSLPRAVLDEDLVDILDRAY